MKIILFCLATLFIPTFVSADVIDLNTGSTVVGQLLEINEHDIRVATNVGFPIYYYYENIYRINGLSALHFKEIYYQDKSLISDNDEINLSDEGLVDDEIYKRNNFSKGNYEENVKFNILQNENNQIDLSEYLNDSNGKKQNFKENKSREILTKEPEVIVKIDVELGSTDAMNEFFKENEVPLGGNNIEELKIDEDNNINSSKNNQNNIKVNWTLLQKSNVVNRVMDRYVFIESFGIIFNQILRFELNFIIKKFDRILSQFPTIVNVFKLGFNEAFKFYKVKFGFIAVKIIVLFIILILYSLYCYPLMLVAKIFNLKSLWMAWIPLFQQILIIRMANKSLWFLFLYFIPFVRFLNIAYLWSEISFFMGKSRINGIFMLVPFVNLIVLWKFSFFNRK